LADARPGKFMPGLWIGIEAGVGQSPREETAGERTATSVVRRYGRLIDADGVGGAGVGVVV